MKDYVTTMAVRNYQKEHNLTTREVAEKIGVKEKQIHNWNHANRYPREILQKLGLKARRRAIKSPSQQNAKAGGAIYACYVSSDKKAAFDAFCAAVGVNAKLML